MDEPRGAGYGQAGAPCPCVLPVGAGRGPRAFRAPLAERSAVNRQVLGSIPSGGVLFVFPARCVRCAAGWPWQPADAMAQWQRVGFQIRRLGVRIPLASSRLSFFASELACGGRCVPPGRGVQTPWRNGSASDSKSEGWGFESLWRQVHPCFTFALRGSRGARNGTPASHPSLWPNWTRRLTTNQKIGGSSPSRDNFFFFAKNNVPTRVGEAK